MAFFWDFCCHRRSSVSTNLILKVPQILIAANFIPWWYLPQCHFFLWGCMKFFIGTFTLKSASCSWCVCLRKKFTWRQWKKRVEWCYSMYDCSSSILNYFNVISFKGLCARVISFYIFYQCKLFLLKKNYVVGAILVKSLQQRLFLSLDYQLVLFVWALMWFKSIPLVLMYTQILVYFLLKETPSLPPIFFTFLLLANLFHLKISKNLDIIRL